MVARTKPSQIYIYITSLPPFSICLSSSDTGNKTIGAIAETSNVFSSMEALPVTLEEFTPRRPMVDLKLYGVPKLSLDSNLCLFSIRLCFPMVLLTSRSALALDLVFISSNTRSCRPHYVHIYCIFLNYSSITPHCINTLIYRSVSCHVGYLWPIM